MAQADVQHMGGYARTGISGISSSGQPAGDRALVRHDDVIIALLGASASLAGLVLVFLGIVISTAQGYYTDSPVMRPWYRWSTRISMFTLSPFLVGIICVGESTIWLLTRNNEGLYLATVGTFGLQIVLLLAVAFYVTWRVVSITQTASRQGNDRSAATTNGDLACER
jgi:hypothetical protein